MIFLYYHARLNDLRRKKLVISFKRSNFILYMKFDQFDYSKTYSNLFLHQPY